MTTCCDNDRTVIYQWFDDGKCRIWRRGEGVFEKTYLMIDSGFDKLKQIRRLKQYVDEPRSVVKLNVNVVV